MKQEIINRNQKGHWHGYQERYSNGFDWDDISRKFQPVDTIELRGVYHNDRPIGYEEWHVGMRMCNYCIR